MGFIAQDAALLNRKVDIGVVPEVTRQQLAVRAEPFADRFNVRGQQAGIGKPLQRKTLPATLNCQPESVTRSAALLGSFGKNFRDPPP